MKTGFTGLLVLFASLNCLQQLVAKPQAYLSSRVQKVSWSEFSGLSTSSPTTPKAKMNTSAGDAAGQNATGRRVAQAVPTRSGRQQTGPRREAGRANPDAITFDKLTSSSECHTTRTLMQMEFKVFGLVEADPRVWSRAVGFFNEQEELASRLKAAVAIQALSPDDASKKMRDLIRTQIQKLESEFGQAEMAKNARRWLEMKEKLYGPGFRTSMPNHLYD